MIKISQNFDAGAITVLQADAFDDIQLDIRKDSHADFAQWFYFRLQGARGQACRIRFMNAAKCAYPDGWKDYRVCASYDRLNWFRVNDTSFDGQVLEVRHTPEHDSVYYAYFEPYPWERHLNLISHIGHMPGVRVLALGDSVEGREIDALQLGNPDARHKIWVIARQHPGETMAEWFVEGMLQALTDESNPLGRQLLAHACWYVVPNMNPDGAVRGNLRTNAAGANLNREWMTPDPLRSPEVLAVKRKIEETGVDMFFDIHGDEGLPYNFVAGSEMLEGFSAEQLAQQNKFVADYMQASPDFQNRYGYAADKYNQDMLKLASKYIGHYYKCLSLTLEMPFKDNADLPDAVVGWDGERSRQLGIAFLQPVWQALQGLMAK
ncbi:M14-type cytosolic carboxypeptidase [Massilia sp. W12]|uniref:M14 family metallopeptidase n=1 Tax=Massilia sp. W12 TaxID=3126507 RepID=UPI0030CF4A49